VSSLEKSAVLRVEGRK